MLTMKKQLTLTLLACAALSAQAQNTFEGKFTRPLGEVLEEISTRFNVRLAYDIVDYGDGNNTASGYLNDKDHVIQFRTAINF